MTRFQTLRRILYCLIIEGKMEPAREWLGRKYVDETVNDACVTSHEELKGTNDKEIIFLLTEHRLEKH